MFTFLVQKFDAVFVDYIKNIGDNEDAVMVFEKYHENVDLSTLVCD